MELGELVSLYRQQAGMTIDDLIEKYRALDTPGQNAVDWLLDHETIRVAALSERDNRIKIIEAE